MKWSAYILEEFQASELRRPDAADGCKKTTSLGATLAWARAWAVHLVKKDNIQWKGV